MRNYETMNHQHRRPSQCEMRHFFYCVRLYVPSFFLYMASLLSERFNGLLIHVTFFRMWYDAMLIIIATRSKFPTSILWIHVSHRKFSIKSNEKVRKLGDNSICQLIVNLLSSLECPVCHSLATLKMDRFTCTYIHSLLLGAAESILV